MECYDLWNPLNGSHQHAFENGKCYTWGAVLHKHGLNIGDFLDPPMKDEGRSSLSPLDRHLGSADLYVGLYADMYWIRK